jgi:hypothetical protein
LIMLANNKQIMIFLLPEPSSQINIIIVIHYLRAFFIYHIKRDCYEAARMAYCHMDSLFMYLTFFIQIRIFRIQNLQERMIQPNQGVELHIKIRKIVMRKLHAVLHRKHNNLSYDQSRNHMNKMKHQRKFSYRKYLTLYILQENNNTDEEELYSYVY